MNPEIFWHNGFTVSQIFFFSYSDLTLNLMVLASFQLGFPTTPLFIVSVAGTFFLLSFGVSLTLGSSLSSEI